MYELSTTAGLAQILLTENERKSNNPRWQRDERPEIDEVICNTLEGNALKDALNFVDNIRASKMKIEWSSINVWSVHRGMKHIMDIRIANGTWHLTLLLDHANSGAAQLSTEMEGVRKLINSLKHSVSSPREAQYASV